MRLGSDELAFGVLRFFFARVSALGDKVHCSCTVEHCLRTVHETHNHFIQEKKNIKNGSHDTIYTFKNYFIIVFSVFNKINHIQIESKKLRLRLFWCKTISGNGFTPQCMFGCAWKIKFSVKPFQGAFVLGENDFRKSFSPFSACLVATENTIFRKLYSY